jgi:acetyl-CoA/propionyl-CoA carboxylase, biotin carboxylase, biotin carboxyl carrier protein
MFSKVLVANRGEIAVRVLRTLRRLGVASVAVYSDADTGARHVTEADEAIRIGPPPAAQSYLNIDAIVAAALAAGAQAIHPGYGFLAENAGFARACAAAGLVFVGPPPAAIEAMGDKIAAKATVAAAGVPVVPGAGRRGLTDDDLITQITRLQNDPWFHLLVKPSAGGGGKGMHVVRSAAELPGALAAARREAIAAFGDGTLLVERYLETPRHIEIQVLADSHATVVHLGERECSLQRRHQKIIEEAPSPLLDAARREAMGQAAIEAARSVGYVGAGTIEFIVGDGPQGDKGFEFFFMEMNTRLQVEHPVTELIYGLDLVEWQLRVAAGERLPFAAGAVPATGGHAVEARVYAEDPARGFLPTGGTVLALREPAGPDVRVDSGLAQGMAVTSAYDPMLAKVIAWGEDRPTALRRLDAALARTVILGVPTNISFLRTLLADPDVRAGRLDTGLAERVAASRGPDPSSVPDDVLAAAALARLLKRHPGDAAGTTGPARIAASVDPWDIPDGWRIGAHAWTTFRFATGAAGPTAEVRVRWLAPEAAEGATGAVGAEVAIGDGVPVAARAEFRAGDLRAGDLRAGDRRAGDPCAGDPHGADLLLTYGGTTRGYVCATDGATTWLGRDGHAWALTEQRAAPLRTGSAGLADATVRSPMPGTVVTVQVAEGAQVTAGEPLLIVEAMKMEHVVIAPVGGVVTELTARPGQQVSLDETLAIIKEHP